MSQRFARFAAAVLGYNLLVILWGAYVRATGSGAGCGNHWPLCNGVAVPHSAAVNTMIELTHRLMSGLDVLAVAVLLVWAYRSFPKSHPARLGAALSAVFLATEALIGAALVLLQHVAQDPSLGHAYWDAIHLVNTLTLLACLTLTAWWADGGTRARLRGRAAWLALPGILLFVLLGISGALAALGDTLYPVRSLAEGLRQDFNPGANVLLRLRLLHPMLAVVTGSWLVFYAGLYRRWSLVSLVVLQVGAGALNLVLLAPIWMQMVHLLLADLVWIALILLCASALQAPPMPADLPIDAIPPRVDRLERVGPAK
ncbi:MAG TPA: COX15/CtaA family protein [Bryobacteraceae bacterium]|nr:COX15/CtaA family protein [Bryobacteraceae bacterium]